MNKKAFLQNYNAGYLDELEKLADLIPKQVYKDLPDYEKRRLVEAKETIIEATKKTTKLPVNIREKMIESAIESIKGVSYDMARTTKPKEDIDRPVSTESVRPKPPASL